jgi:flagellin
MAITLGSNIASLRGQRQLAKTSAELVTAFERLSSGQRINEASDDGAGLAIADSLNAKSRILNQGVRNVNDGLSLLSIADSAIEILSDIVIRLEELAEQAANGV